jgi:hypothetical protein
MCHITNSSFHLTLNTLGFQHTAQTGGDVQPNNSLSLITCNHAKLVLWEVSRGPDIRDLKV